MQLARETPLLQWGMVRQLHVDPLERYLFPTLFAVMREKSG